MKRWLKLKKKKTIEELSAIYFSIPHNELGRSLTNNESIPNEEGKTKLDDILNNTLEAEDLLESKYEELIRKGDEEPPLLELKPISKDLRYEYLDEEKKCTIIISNKLYWKFNLCLM
jgi:hypothetical protein